MSPLRDWKRWLGVGDLLRLSPEDGDELVRPHVTCVFGALIFRRGLMAKAQSRHSVWDESIESHAGRESVVF